MTDILEFVLCDYSGYPCLRLPKPEIVFTENETPDEIRQACLSFWEIEGMGSNHDSFYFQEKISTIGAMLGGLSRKEAYKTVHHYSCLDLGIDCHRCGQRIVLKDRRLRLPVVADTFGHALCQSCANESRSGDFPHATDLRAKTEIVYNTATLEPEWKRASEMYWDFAPPLRFFGKEHEPTYRYTLDDIAKELSDESMSNRAKELMERTIWGMCRLKINERCARCGKPIPAVVSRDGLQTLWESWRVQKGDRQWEVCCSRECEGPPESDGEERSTYIRIVDTNNQALGDMPYLPRVGEIIEFKDGHAATVVEIRHVIETHSAHVVVSRQEIVSAIF